MQVRNKSSKIVRRLGYKAMYCYECTYWFRTMSDRGFCESEKWNVDTVTSKDQVILFSEDHCKCGVYTGPNFGCIH